MNDTYQLLPSAKPNSKLENFCLETIPPNLCSGCKNRDKVIRLLAEEIDRLKNYDANSDRDK
ncbi:MAG: hypothetical protein H0V90_00990 [Blastocatellia bacterium]|nr:hypothetical protein [Blastocatellia bacterium]